MIYTKTILPIYKLSTAKVNIFFDIYKFFLKKTERTFENKVVPLPPILAYILQLCRYINPESKKI